MCVFHQNRQLDPKSRRMRAIGCSSLAIALVLQQFTHPASPAEQNWIHAIGGFLLGISIVFNVAGLARCRRAKQI